ncbi:MAG: hypothetical protein WDN69_05995 [Aliidongia sp.]
MTITTNLSAARTQALHTTQSAQQKRNGHVQFSLPPVSDPTAPAGSSTPALGQSAPVSAPPKPSLTLLPIAKSGAALGDPVTTATAQSANGAATPGAANQPPGGGAPGHGNLASARLISRLYQRPA